MTQIEHGRELFWRIMNGDWTAIVDLLKVGVLLVLTSLLAKPYAAFTGILACVVMYNRVLKTISKRKEQESKTREQEKIEAMTGISLERMRKKVEQENKMSGEF